MHAEPASREAPSRRLSCIYAMRRPNQMEETMTNGTPVQWRHLAADSCVWAPVGKNGCVGWRPACVVGFGHNLGERTIVRLTFGKTWRFRHFDTIQGRGTRRACELLWRDPNARKNNKPRPNREEVL